MELALLFAQVHCRQIVYRAHITEDYQILVNPTNVKANIAQKFTQKSWKNN